MTVTASDETAFDEESTWGIVLRDVFSKSVEFFHRMLPVYEPLNLEGRSDIPEFHPSLWNFFWSPNLYLAVFVNVLNNRINAIIAPRTPRPLPTYIRLAIRLPCFYLMIKSALVLIACIADERQWTQEYMGSLLKGYSMEYTDAQALWLCLKSLSAVYVMKQFHSSMENRSLPGREQATNLYEWALLFHLYVSNRHPNTDLLLIALLELLDIMLLEILYIHPRGIQYRLIPTSFVGILGIVHYAYALRYRSDTYPLLQSIARFPELALIGIIIMCTILHGVAIVVTGGNVRRRFFLDARTLPTLNQDYTMALYQVGTACVEATRIDGFRNELNPVAVPMGTIFEANRKKSKKANKRRPTCGFDNEQLDDSGVSLSPPEQDDNPQRFTLLSNFSYQLLQTVSAFGGWILEFVPFINFGRARRQHITPSSASSVAATAAALQAVQQSLYHNSETEVDVEEELYNNFLQNETIDDQDDDEYNEDSQTAEGSLEDEEQDDIVDDVGEVYTELLSLGSDIREQIHNPASNLGNSSGLQLFITHLVHSPVLTRTQYRRLTQTPPASAVYDEAAALLTLMEERQAVSDTLTNPITDRLCVICHTEPRQCLLKPCRCFAICDDCRQAMAQKRFKKCPCCRSDVEGYCRIYVP
ncbi:6315_t:CDS:2 [Paraglomus occultum]|uniref:6315_t:CDS:1 n=1 Tax=Paraglomus occultum TaxID=144539 RepID=A0A9N9B744_9GLOM|nr:6315_t:CDS:2 [Paraglomus occultum]